MKLRSICEPNNLINRRTNIACHIMSLKLYNNILFKYLLDVFSLEIAKLKFTNRRPPFRSFFVHPICVTTRVLCAIALFMDPNSY